jgi:hypothetical protein
MSEPTVVYIGRHLFQWVNSSFTVLSNKPSNPVFFIPEVREWLDDRELKYGDDWVVDVMTLYDAEKRKWVRIAYIMFANEMSAMEFKLRWS